MLGTPSKSPGPTASPGPALAAAVRFPAGPAEAQAPAEDEPPHEPIHDLQRRPGRASASSPAGRAPGVMTAVHVPSTATETATTAARIRLRWKELPSSTVHIGIRPPEARKESIRGFAPGPPKKQGFKTQSSVLAARNPSSAIRKPE